MILRRPRRDSLTRIQKSSHTSLQQLQHTNIPAILRAAIKPPRQTILRSTGEMLASSLSVGQILAVALPCTSILAVATLVGVWYYKRRTGEQVEALMAAAILRLRLREQSKRPRSRRCVLRQRILVQRFRETTLRPTEPVPSQSSRVASLSTSRWRRPLGVDLEASVFAGSERIYHRVGLERVIISVQHPALTKTTRHT
jgi:hypothetical protein